MQIQLIKETEKTITLVAKGLFDGNDGCFRHRFIEGGDGDYDFGRDHYEFDYSGVTYTKDCNAQAMWKKNLGERIFLILYREGQGLGFENFSLHRLYELQGLNSKIPPNTVISQMGKKYETKYFLDSDNRDEGFFFNFTTPAGNSYQFFVKKSEVGETAYKTLCCDGMLEIIDSKVYKYDEYKGKKTGRLESIKFRFFDNIDFATLHDLRTCNADYTLIDWKQKWSNDKFHKRG